MTTPYRHLSRIKNLEFYLILFDITFMMNTEHNHKHLFFSVMRYKPFPTDAISLIYRHSVHVYMGNDELHSLLSPIQTFKLKKHFTICTGLNRSHI